VNLRDLGEHLLKDLAHSHRLFQVVAAGLPADFPSLKSLSVLANNLPRQLTSFIGREREMAEVKRLLSTAPLVTLTGTGGVGKTRLALQVAADVLDHYSDGVWLVEFAPIVDPALVPKTVASALNVPEQPGRELLDTLVDAVRSKALLLVLDNCEHLLAACRELAAALLRKCPRVRILATSREGLGVPGEMLWRVPSLSVPEDICCLPNAKELVLYDAVRLFVDRAVATAPGFAVTSENAPAVAQVCQRLDGMPLAIELAAARVNILAVEQIAARLDDRFRLLTGGSQIVLPRQRTLRAAIDWSYNLLSEPERVLLRRLSVFAGGWTLEAAEAVCGGGSVEADQVLDLLTSLVDKSLVLAEMHHGEARYRLLETVRQYGRDRLVESNEAAPVRTRHRDWYLALAERAEPELRRASQDGWLHRLETEHDNLRAALEWSRIEEGGAEAGLRLAGTLHVFWHMRGYWGEGRGWLERALARCGEAPVDYLPKALHGAAQLMRRLGDYDRAAPLCEKGLALSRELGDHRYAAWFLIHFGIVALQQSHYAEATRLFEEALTLGRESQDQWWICLGLNHLAEVALREGNYVQAAGYFLESLTLARELGDKYLIAYILRYWGEVDLRRGNYEQAAARYTEGLTVSCELGARRETEGCIDGLAQLACANGNYEQAGRLFGATETLRAVLGLRREAVEQAHHDQRVAATRAALREESFDAAWAKGRAMTLEQAIEYALTDQPDVTTHNCPFQVKVERSPFSPQISRDPSTGARQSSHSPLISPPTAQCAPPARPVVSATKPCHIRPQDGETDIPTG
jgi:predicted ATPase